MFRLMIQNNDTTTNNDINSDDDDYDTVDVITRK